MGISRRFLNLIVDRRIPGRRSLCRIDLNHQTFFHPQPSATTVAGSESSVAAGLSTTQTRASSDAGNPRSRKQPNGLDSVMERCRFCDSTIMFRVEGVPHQWHINCLPLADGKVICADQSRHTILLDANLPRVVTMPNIHNIRCQPISLYVPDVGADADQGSSSKLYIMEKLPKQEDGCGSMLPSDQFEVFVYRRPADSWHCELLPPPPFVRDPTYRSISRHQTIQSYAVVGSGSHICISNEDAGTYCLDTADNTWSKVGEWKLPFNGKAEYVPELKLWFGTAAESGHFAAADLSTIFTMGSQPQLLGEWKDFDPPEGCDELQDSEVVNLGSGRLCITRIFDPTLPDVDYGKQDYVVLNCVEVRAAHDGNCSGGENGKVNLGVTMFKPRLLMSQGMEIDAVF
jgi:hypothetical protein